MHDNSTRLAPGQPPRHGAPAPLGWGTAGPGCSGALLTVKLLAWLTLIALLVFKAARMRMGGHPGMGRVHGRTASPEE